jgi:3-deoxy-D-manno-octulosonate 8-phosphate phosphatase (KDO 8-P phosphatase)
MKKKIPNYFIIDVDGVMTTGIQGYSSKGKILKFFGAHDNDGLKKLKKYININFITADKSGYDISKKRIVNDMKFKLDLINENYRYDFLDKKYGLKNIIYMGDGIYDANIIKDCMYGITPRNARIEAKKVSNYITMSKSGEGAVLDACIKVLKFFFKKNFID